MGVAISRDLLGVRSVKANTGDGGAVLDAPGMSRAGKAEAVRRMPGAPALRRGLDRRDLGEDFAAGRDEDEGFVRRRSGGVRFRLKGGVPRSTVGRVVAGCVLVAAMVGFTAALWELRSMLGKEPRLVIESSAAIQITGNKHLTRPQLLSVFGEDVERNVLTVPLEERRAELERLPWVEHATVMRLLPNRFRVAIVERTPVAFVRQGSRIGLVDAHGVLLDMAPEADGTDEAGETHYSFPVVTGLVQADPVSVRAARMKLFQRFEAELDAGGERVSKELSEVDLSNPEDVKALIPAGKSDVLVHFGDKDFLHRYELFEKNLAGWQASYPRLASADMRYERQVVLEMAPGTAVSAAAPAGAGEKTAEGAKGAVGVKKDAGKAGKGAGKTAVVAEPTHHAARDEWGTQGGSTVKGAGGAAATGGHLQTAFDVPVKGKTHPAAGGPPQ